MTLSVLSLTTISYADGIIIPMSIKVEQFKKEVKEKGLDLYGSDSSDGEVQNLGTSMKVITYRPATLDELDLIKDVSFKTVRK